MKDETKSIISVVVTKSNKLSDISIKNAQLIFVKDKKYIALDYDGKRDFYNQIVTLQSEDERQSTTPIQGFYYFVVSTAVLWVYTNKWIQITTPPTEVIFIGAKLPELGVENTLYVNKSDKCISVWDEENKKYVVVSDITEEITTDEILLLFDTKK